MHIRWIGEKVASVPEPLGQNYFYRIREWWTRNFGCPRQHTAQSLDFDILPLVLEFERVGRGQPLHSWRISPTP